MGWWASWLKASIPADMVEVARHLLRRDPSVLHELLHRREFGHRNRVLLDGNTGARPDVYFDGDRGMQRKLSDLEDPWEAGFAAGKALVGEQMLEKDEMIDALGFEILTLVSQIKSNTYMKKMVVQGNNVPGTVKHK